MSFVPRYCCVIAVLGCFVFAQQAAAQQAEPDDAAKPPPGTPPSAQDKSKVATDPQAIPAQRGVNRTTTGEADKPRIETERGGVVSKTNITSDALQSSNAQNTYDAIKNVPGVAPADARGGSTADSLQIRGIKLSSTTGYRLDGGLPIVNNINLPIEDKYRVEALKGAGALQFGVASPAGIINYVLKRAPDAPVTSFQVNTNIYGQGIGAVDVARKFGADNQFGLRVNLAGGEFGSFVRGAGGTRYLASVAGDWNPTERASVLIDFEQFGIDVVEQAALLQNKPVKGHVTIPRVPDPTKLLSGSWARSIGLGQNFFMRDQYLLDYGFRVVGEVGRSEGNRPERFVSQVGSYNLATGLGTESVTLVRNQVSVNTYANLALKNHSEYGVLSNDFSVGINRNERDFNNPTNITTTFAQNIFNPIATVAPINPYGRVYQPNDSHDIDYYFTDTVNLWDRVHLLGGLRQINYEADDTVGSVVRREKTMNLAPGVGTVIDVWRNVSVYASYVSSLEETGQAPANAANAYTVLAPAEATQKEIGVRATDLNGFSGSFGYFVINRGNATLDSTTNIYALNGTTKFEGLEATENYLLTPAWSVNAGGQFMKARQISTDLTINGKEPENTPRLSGNLGLVYRAEWLKGLTLNASALFIGRRQVNPQDQGYIPGYPLYQIGANYVTKIRGQRVSFNANCTNLLDKRYYSSAVSGALGVGSPRTVSFSAHVDF